jgi:hypothetical protein
MRRKEMRKRAIPLTVLIAITIGSPPTHPEQERDVIPGRIELLPEQLDTVKAGQFLTCMPTSPSTFMCMNTPTPCAGAVPVPGFITGITGIAAICP